MGILRTRLALLTSPRLYDRLHGGDTAAARLHPRAASLWAVTYASLMPWCLRRWCGVVQWLVRWLHPSWGYGACMTTLPSVCGVSKDGVVLPCATGGCVGNDYNSWCHLSAESFGFLVSCFQLHLLEPGSNIRWSVGWCKVCFLVVDAAQWRAAVNSAAVLTLRLTKRHAPDTHHKHAWRKHTQV